MPLAICQQSAVALLSSLRFANPLARKFAALDITERGSHALMNLAINDLRPHREVSPLCGFGNPLAHSAEPALLHKIDDELQFMQTFEIGQLRWVSRFHESL